MRICFLEGDMSRSGGTERMTAWLANALCRNHEVSIFSLRMESKDVFFPLDSKVTHKVLPLYSGKSGIIKQIRWIHHQIKDMRFNWVINVDVGMGFYGILAAKGTKAKTVTWEHGNFYNNWGSRLFPYMRAYAAKNSDTFVVLTEQDRSNYASHFRRHAPLHVIPNPVEPKEILCNPNCKTILSVGHLLENKGYHRAIQVAAKVLPSHPDWKWVICGEGPQRNRLESMIKELGLEHQMLLPGLIKNMSAMYRQASILVMTSEMEGLPMVLLEGKAHHIPLISFDIMTGPSEIIIDGVNGYLIQPFEIEKMAQRICSLMDDDALRIRFSNSSALGMERFSEEGILKQWQEVLENA